jgi:CBS domain-containing protein
MNTTPHTVDADTTVTETARNMIQTGATTAIVTKGDKIKGIVTQSSILRYTYTPGFRPQQTPVSEITNNDIILARPNTSLEDCLTIMTELKQDTLPVVDNKLVGSINIHDLLHAKPHTKPQQTMPPIAQSV